MNSFEKLTDNTEKSSGNPTTVAILAGVALQAARAEVKRHDGGKPFLIHRDQFGNDKVVDVDYLGKNPTMVEKHLVFNDVGSFNHYVNQFKDEGSNIFVNTDINHASIKAILDYHIAPVSGAPAATPDDEVNPGVPLCPRWGRHIAEYSFPTTPEWQELLASNRKVIQQLAFAEMIERLRTVFHDPDAATMLEIARTLEAKTESIFKSGLNLQNGDRELEFTTKTEGSAGRNEKLQIPHKITLSIQPFVRGANFQVETMLRYKVRDGKVTFEYEIVKPHEFVDFAVKQIVDKVNEDTQILPLYAAV